MFIYFHLFSLILIILFCLQRSSQKKISPYLRDQKNKELKIHGLQNEQEKRPSTQKEREEVIDSEDEELISEYGKGSNFLVNMKFDEKQYFIYY